MKQQINLYQVEKQKWFFNVTFQYLTWASTAFLGLLCMITLYEVLHHFAVTNQLTQLQKDQMNRSKALQTIAGQMPEERTREQLVHEIKRYESEKQAKQEILASLAINSRENKGFSSYLDALSLKTRAGLWFTKLRFEENGNFISLEGGALKPEYVPNLMMDLSNDPAFSGKQFELFQESLDEKTKQLNFILATKTVKEP